MFVAPQVSPDNKPGRTLDLSGDSAAAQAARALQSVLDGDEATNDAKITAHEDERFMTQTWASLGPEPTGLKILGRSQPSPQLFSLFVFSRSFHVTH